MLALWAFTVTPQQSPANREMNLEKLHEKDERSGEGEEGGTSGWFMQRGSHSTRREKPLRMNAGRSGKRRGKCKV